MSRQKVQEVQITYDGGKVDHYIASQGDLVVCNHVYTHRVDDLTGRTIPVYYITIQITPVVERSQKDKL